MADKPILFSAPMIRALLDGRKTQTRRLLSSARVFRTPESPAFTLKSETLTRALQGADRWRHLGGDGWFWEADAFDYQAPATRTGWMAHLPYAPGDRLYVRESCYLPPKHISARDWREGADTWPKVIYAEDDRDGGRDMMERCCWRSMPSIHMPRWASRLWLNVTDVRVQCLQEISEADARAEGIEQVSFGQLAEFSWQRESAAGALHAATAKSAFEKLWNSLHTKPGETWDDNAWIVAVTFEVNRGNIDGGDQ